jgi:hypothetical protein
MRESGYAVDERTDSTLTLSLSDLPPVRTVIVLEPSFLADQ